MSDITSSNRKRSNLGNPTGTRKRGRYTAAACNECKKRKTKCSGDNPCKSCHELEVNCVYSAESADTLSLKNTSQLIQELQQQVQQLWQAVHTIKSIAGTSASSENQAKIRDRTIASPNEDDGRSRFQSDPTRRRRNSLRPLGPTSSEYGLQFAEPVLMNMGVPVTQENFAQEPRSHVLGVVGDRSGQQHHSLSEILQEIGRIKTLALLESYREDIGLQYPFLDVDSVVDYAKSQFSSEGQSNAVFLQNCDSQWDDGREDVLAATLAVALAAQRQNEDIYLADDLMKTLEQCHVFRGAQNCDIDRGCLIMLILQGMYYFFRNDERLAWRIIGIVARMCEEAGFGRRSIVSQEFGSPAEQLWMRKLFWSIYVLDRRWSFGIGLSFALQDSSIDLNVDLPNDDASQYLRSMIDYCHIASRVWQKNTTSPKISANDAPNEQKFLEYLVRDWLRSLSTDLRISNPEHGYDAAKFKRGNFRLRILLHLRANQMCILIYRNTLFSQQNQESNNDKVRDIVNTARETIRILVALNRTSDIYRTQQVCFNHFLDSALTVLVLAVCQSPNKYPKVCRQEFHSALELVQTLSMPSPISRRLWQVVRKLKDIALPEKDHIRAHSTNRSERTNVEAMTSEFSPPGLKLDQQSANYLWRSTESSSDHLNQDISNIFWELFDAGNYSFGEESNSQAIGIGEHSTLLTGNETERRAPAAPRPNNTFSLLANSGADLSASVESQDAQAVDVTGQRALGKAELDFFDLASHVQSSNLAELSNDMFFF